MLPDLAVGHMHVYAGFFLCTPKLDGESVSPCATPQPSPTARVVHTALFEKWNSCQLALRKGVLCVRNSWLRVSRLTKLSSRVPWMLSCSYFLVLIHVRGETSSSSLKQQWRNKTFNCERVYLFKSCRLLYLHQLLQLPRWFFLLITTFSSWISHAGAPCEIRTHAVNGMTTWCCATIHVCLCWVQWG